MEGPVTEFFYYGISIALIAGILVGIALMSKVEKAAFGNLLSVVCASLAIALTMLYYGVLSVAEIWICIGIGLVIGVIGAIRAKMIHMPQVVALLNGFGGAASAIVAAVVLYEGAGISLFEELTAGVALCVGMLTLTGSLIAVGKLHGVLTQRPIVWKLHQQLSIASIALMVVLIAALPFNLPFPAVILLFALFLVSGFFGIALAIRVGGADMPLTIALLNSLTGVAVSMMGMSVGDPLLVAVGGIVGAAGLILTRIMCRAMNRSLSDIMLGKTSVAHTGGGAADAAKATAQVAVADAAAASAQQTAINSAELAATATAADSAAGAAPVAQDPCEVLSRAKKVIIVPGYGMALAQAQELVKELSDKLEKGGAEVKLAIHPVAGRMPGHMNVLLAEVEVPYDKLYEIDDINPEFEQCDAAIVVGANDVINPAANTDVDTPIYGMPILDVEKAKNIIICNFDKKPGYAGVPNPLYDEGRAILLLGDAKESLTTLLAFDS